MVKITDLEEISGNSTRPEDVFVVVNIVQGDDGTKKITRKELINALEQETFDDINITGGSISDTPIVDPNITVNDTFQPDIQGDDYFYLKDVSINKTVAISYSQFYTEIAKTSQKAKKIYVSPDGDDSAEIGSYFEPVATLEKAAEMAQEQVSNVDPDFLGDRGVCITVLPGTYYTNGEIALPDFCSMVSTNGQYSTNIVMNTGYETKNCILVGSGCYVQGFSFQNLKVDNFDYPSGGFAIAFRPGTKITRSPYIRDCSQISNFFRRDIVDPLDPFNSKGGIEDLGYQVFLSSVSGVFEVGDSVETSDGVTGFISRIEELSSDNYIYIRNNSGTLNSAATITTSSGGTATISSVGEEDFPNKLVGRGGGMLLADRAVVDQDSLYPYMLAFGATPRSPNGIGYVAKNGAGINGIGSLSIFTRCAFYALDGGQVTLNNSGTQFGDISMRAKGSTNVFNPYEVLETDLLQNTNLADSIISNRQAIIDDMWNYLTNEGYTVDEALTRRDAGNFLQSIANDFRSGQQNGTRVFTAGLFDYKGTHVFSVFEPPVSDLTYIGSLESTSELPAGSTVNINDAYIIYGSNQNIYQGDVRYWNGSSWINAGANDISLLNAFLDSYDRMVSYIKNNVISSLPAQEQNPPTGPSPSEMLDDLIDNILKASLINPRIISFGSIVESLAHQFNLASAGVNANALPLNFRRVGQPISAEASILEEESGRVRWSGADELNNQYFARGLRINGRTGKIEGRPFTSSVRKLARRASNSRALI